MASYSPPRKSLWESMGPNRRLLLGAALIALVGFVGMTPKTVFGVTLIWPYATLWGAMGWGRVGLSLRPMLILILFGLVLDINTNAPLGCFVVMNLVVYGLSASAAGKLDLESEPIMAIAVPTALLLAGYVTLWIIASAFTNFPQKVTPLVVSFLVTGLGYALLGRFFHLIVPPGIPWRKAS